MCQEHPKPHSQMSLAFVFSFTRRLSVVNSGETVSGHLEQGSSQGHWQVYLRSNLPSLETTHWLNRLSTAHVLGYKGGKQRLWSPSIHFNNLFATKGLFGWDLFKNEIWGNDQDGRVEEHEAHLLPQVHKKYVYMLDCSHRISTECWWETSDLWKKIST